MKKDNYLRKKGGTFRIIDIVCAHCDKVLFIYQKDGRGFLKRCYLNRILAPAKFEKLQYDLKIREAKDLENLKCSCGRLIGVPTKYRDGRLAFRLEKGKFKRKLNKKFK